MKKKMFLFFTMILIIISISLVVIANSIGYGKINEIPMNIETDQTESIEETENVNVIETKTNDEIAQENSEIDEFIDQPQVTEIPKEEKVDSPVVQTKQETKVTQIPSVTTQESKKETSKVETTKTEIPKQEEKKEVKTPKCSGNSHGVGIGNSGRWFNSEAEAISYYKSIIKTWGNKWENFEIDDATYQKNCPYGYEDWSCPYCGKWTINFYYN